MTAAAKPKFNVAALRASMQKALEKTDDIATGKSLIAQGEYKLAADEFEKVLANQPKHIPSRSNLTLCYLKLERYQELIEHADFALDNINPATEEDIRRKLIFRRVIAKENLGADDEGDVEELRELSRLYYSAGKTKEAQITDETFHRLVRSQRIRDLKNSAKADGWDIDETEPPSPRTLKLKKVIPPINVRSDYFNTAVPDSSHDREIKTLRSEENDKLAVLPKDVEERLRDAENAHTPKILGPKKGVRPMGEIIPEVAPPGDISDDSINADGNVSDEEKEFEPQLNFYAEFSKRATWKKDLLDKWEKYG